MSANYDINIKQGSDFSLTITVKDFNKNPVDLTGHVFAGDIRKNVSDENPIASFSFELLDQVTNTGEVRITLSAAVSSAINLAKSKKQERNKSRYLYDIESTNGSGAIRRWLEGYAFISPEITR